MFSSNTTQAGPSGPANYIEEMFSTDLYTGTSASQTITNGIDLATKGGMVWMKRRASTVNHWLADTARGRGSYVSTNTTAAETYSSQTGNDFTSFNSNGFTLGVPTNIYVNETTGTYASWTFRKQAKFFDVVTYTGTGSQQSINHSLGSTPGCIIVKRTDTTSSYWGVYHRSLTDTYALGLNTTDAQFAAPSYFVNSASQTSTQFTVGTSANVNASGGTYVAYLFAHNAGGFGLTGTDNVITCGSYTGSASNVDINLGYEAQWVLVKNITTAGTNWQMLDIMRGMPLLGSALTLAPNLFDAESSNTAPVIIPTATGMTITGGIGGSINSAGSTYIYIAIRRGPMRVPTSGTSVFLPSQQPEANGGSGFIVTTTFPPDLFISSTRGSNSYNRSWFDRLRGNGSGLLLSTSTAAETSIGNTPFGIVKNGLRPNMFSTNPVQYMFGRAPGFFDEVCYTGTGVARTVAHNLGVVPELMIVKPRSNANTEWNVYAAPLGPTKYLYLHATNAVGTGVNRWNDTAPTSSVFTVATDTSVNGSGYRLVTYLFATCPGVSKVGSYTSTGTTLQIDCGFTAGARFVMIKRTDAVGDWYVWDSSRGITSGIDPYFLFNNIAAEELTDYLAPYSAGFAVNAGQFVDVNISGGTYIFLAIA